MIKASEKPARQLKGKFFNKIIACGVLVPFFSFFIHPANALVIDATFDSSVTASEQSIINGAIGTYEQMFSDPITVAIEFMTSSTLGGGQSLAGDYVSPYSTYTNSMSLNATLNNNTIEQTAYNNIGYGNKAAQVAFTSADGRALGCSSCTGVVTGEGSVSSTSKFDGIITIGNGYYGNGAQVVYHEIDEVLGIGGQGSMISSTNSTYPVTINGQTAIGTMDLFRYSAQHTPSLTNSTSAFSYFSINGGTTDIVSFNQSGVGDYGDWAGGGACYIQTFDTCNSPLPLSLASPEGIALQAIGYDATVSEPAAILVLVSGIISMLFARKYFSRKAKNRHQPHNFSCVGEGFGDTAPMSV